jgi:hypothetical protein
MYHRHMSRDDRRGKERESVIYSLVLVFLTLTLRMATVIVAQGAFKRSVWDE